MIKMMGNQHDLNPLWDAAIELLLAGASNRVVSERLQVHRNTIGNWIREPRFRVELSRRADARMAEVKLRRLVQVTRLVDRLASVADRVLADAERNPRDRHAQRAARAWLAAYRRARAAERLDVGG